MKTVFRTARSRLFFALAAAGILLWAGLFLIAGNRLATPWRVGGDAPYYVLLASNIAAGRGFSYAGFPSAFRPPIYPLFLSAMLRLAGRHAFVAARLVQLALGLAAVVLLAKLATRLFGGSAGRASLIIGLFLPTILFFPTEIITETFAIFLTSVFLLLVLAPASAFDARRAACTGLVTGLATLVRFNFGALGLLAIWAAVSDAGWKRTVPRLAVLGATFLIVLAPWLVRNDLVFGRPLLSTQGGLNALQGILTPQGRFQPGDLERVVAVSGWVAGSLETNRPSRAALGPEPELDRRAWRLAWHAWRAAGWRAVPVELEKLGYFWLSTDQLFSTGSFPPLLRTLRVIAVLLDWCAMALAVLGWRLLAARHPSQARLLLAYAIIATVIHLPFIMASRYRIPLVDPAVILLAGAGLLDLCPRLPISDEPPVF